MAQQTGPWEATPAVPFLNPGPSCPPSGAWSNEAPVIVDMQKVIALIDLGAQVSSVSSGFCKWMTLKVHLSKLLELEGTGGSTFLYLGYVEVNLPDPRYKGLQWGCLAAGHTDHDLFWEGTGHGGVHDYW